MGYYYFPKSSPRAVKDGIKVKSKRGDIGEQWWSKRFLDALNRMGMDNRLARGRTYARKGQVTSLVIKKGVVHASVRDLGPGHTDRIALNTWMTRSGKRLFQNSRSGSSCSKSPVRRDPMRLKRS